MGEDPELPGTSLEGLGSHVALTLLSMKLSVLCAIADPERWGNEARGTHGS